MPWIAPLGNVGDRVLFAGEGVEVDVVVLNDALDENSTVLVATDDGYTFRAREIELYYPPKLQCNL